MSPVDVMGLTAIVAMAAMAAWGLTVRRASWVLVGMYAVFAAVLVTELWIFGVTVTFIAPVAILTVLLAVLVVRRAIQAEEDERNAD